MATKEQFVVDAEGRTTAVLLDVEYYEKLRDALDELDAIRAYDEAKASGDETIPFAQAIEEIELQRP
jgi:PHD/YefM family antitoxin component YafN of YafNO toxin-antitoxin module